MSTTLRLLFGMFFVSGFCGLIYQSIWSHYLKLFLGHAAYAQTVVLFVFIGGMAAGAWFTGRFSSRLKNPLMAYAGAEFVVGIVALLFHRVYGAVTDWAYISVLPELCAQGGACYPQWLIAAGLILPQSILLGTTFPLMTAGVLRIAPEMPGRKISLLYFLNSFGAAIGVLVSGFLLIPAVGLPGTQLTAGLGNIALAVVVYFVAKFNEQPVLAVSRPMDHSLGAQRIRSEVNLLLVVAALTGLSSFVYEIVWTRMLTLVLGGSTHSFEIMLASFILGLAIGGLWVRRHIDRVMDTIRFLAIVQVAMGVLALLTLPVYDQMFDVTGWIIRSLSRSDSGYTLFTIASTVVAMTVMLPATICAGMTLPLITYRLLGLSVGEKAIGHVYGINTLGGIAGVVLAVHVGLPMMGMKWALIAAAAIDIALGVWLLMKLGQRHQLRRNWGVSMAAMASVAVAAVLFQLDPLKVSSGVFRHGNARQPDTTQMLYSRDGKTATVHVIRNASGAVSINTNGKSDGSILVASPGSARTLDEPTMVLAAAIPLAYKPDIKRVAVIGFGTGLSTATVLGSPRIEMVETIEIEPAMVEGARNFLPVNAAAYNDSRSHIVYDDAKAHFARGRQTYDLILSEPSNPWVSGVASLFTEEFYERMKRYLNDDGLLAQWVQIYESKPEIVASIIAAMKKSFPTFRVYASNFGDLIFIAPKNPARVMQLSEDLFSMPEVQARLARIGVTDRAQIALRMLGTERTIGMALATFGAPVNSDYFPVVDQESPRARFSGSSANALHDLSLSALPAVELLDGRMGGARGQRLHIDSHSPQEQYQAQAALVMRFLTAKDPAEFVWPPQTANLVSPSHLFRVGLLDCSMVIESDVLADAALKVAMAVNAHVDREQATQLWQRVAQSRCLANTPEFFRRWVTLYSAVAARDAAAMGTIASQLFELKPSPNGEAAEYAIAAGMLGSLAAGKPGEAMTLFEKHRAALGRDKDRTTLYLALLANARVGMMVAANEAGRRATPAR